ncbi:Pyridoxamine 5'-phosphate oxidase [Blastococcus aggregatus]|uniref:Pyridoxamine 5'-phosphate oxidase n=1 Tax=Blastococcus aggregatus TaxID=38502 RepID=A0A285V6E8_9ACTN|nr:pyridoxamine 5'-phosphate oxidase family protein [Blastococcus aggregatus]SOC49629.1 Pyridoxamine 5'-phosphate oxidase [Blastococcus aggregatus]
MTPAEGERRVDVLDEAECRALLAASSLARVAFTEGAMPAIQPASFGMSGNDLVISSGLDSGMVAGSRGAVLAFEVDDYDVGARTGWSVTVIGPSRLISDPSRVTALDALGIAPWVPATTRCYIALHMTVVRGRRISSLEAIDSGRPPPYTDPAQDPRMPH